MFGLYSIHKKLMCVSCSHLSAIFKYNITDLSLMCYNEQVIKFNCKNGSYHVFLCGCKNLAGNSTHTVHI